MSLLLASIYTVNASEDVQVITDVEDDVIRSDFTTGTETTVSNRPNADIRLVKYEKNGKTTTVTLTVKGEIENRGSIDELLGALSVDDSDPFDLTMDYALYEIDITTDSNYYGITYINKECNITSSEGYMTPKSLESTGSTLTVTFDLISENEAFESVYAYSLDMKLIAMVGHTYMDIAPDIGELDVSITAPQKIKVDEPVNFLADVQGGSSEYIYDWDFGDGSGYSDLQNSSYTYNKPGIYQVILNVEDALQQNFGTDTFTIEITGEQESSDTNAPTEHGSEKNLEANVGDSSSPALLVFLALISIVVIVGLAVLVFIIRK